MSTVFLFFIFSDKTDLRISLYGQKLTMGPYIVIQKYASNTFEEPELKSVLDRNKVTEILICGLVSHGCVKVSCMGGKNNGLSAFLLKNGHTNWNKDAKLKIISTVEEAKKEVNRIVSIEEL